MKSNNHKQSIGQLGEDIAVRFIESKGFTIIQRNFVVRWIGEIDIIAEKSGIIRFIEVKSVRSVTSDSDYYHPQDNVHAQKLRKVRNAAQAYLQKRQTNSGRSFNWQVDVVLVRIDQLAKNAHVKILENVSFN